MYQFGIVIIRVVVYTAAQSTLRVVVMVVVMVVIVYKQENPHVTEQRKFHCLLQESLLSLAVCYL